MYLADCVDALDRSRRGVSEVLLSRLAIILAVAIAPILVYRVAELHPPPSYARFTGGTFFSDFFTIAKGLVVIVAGGMAWALAWRRTPRYIAIYGGLILVSATTALYSDVVGPGAPWQAEGVFALLAYLGLFVLAMKRSRWGVIVGSLVFSTLVGSAFALCGYFGRYYLLEAPAWLTGAEVGVTVSNHIEQSGTFANANHLGTFAAMAVPFFGMLASHRRAFLIPTLAAGFCLWASHSRGAYVGVTAGGVFAIAHLRWQTCIVGGALAGWFLPLSNIWESITTGGRGRWDIWSNTLPLLKDAMILGNGPGTFALYYPQGVDGSYVDRPHNLYLQIAHQSGILSALLFIGALVFFGTRAAKSRSTRARAALAGVVGFAVAGLFNDSNVGTAPVFWVLLGSMVGESD